MHDSHVRTLAALRKWSVLLDSAFRVPGTNLSFGLDPILGLIPGIGDLTTPLFAALLLLHGVRMRIPRVIQLRMLINAAIDVVIGLVPVIGDFFDFGWKANVRNLALLESYAHPESKPTRGDWIFVLSIVGVLAALTVIPLMFAVWLLSQFRLL
jgi:uncharacterized protein DUF4112